MCGKHACSHVDVHGLTPAGKLSYVAARDCNKHSRSCALNFVGFVPTFPLFGIRFETFPTLINLVPCNAPRNILPREIASAPATSSL